MDWGEACSGWYENVYPSLKANPPFLLYGNHFEIFDFLKVLNWREKKSNQADTLEYYRKESVIFGIPSMETVDKAFRDRLVELKTKFPYMELSYQDSETNIIYIL